MERRRVVITGIGAITSIGNGKEGLWRGVCNGTNGVRSITRFDTSQIKTKVAAEIEDFDPLDYFDAKTSRRMDRFAQMGLAASDLAIADAGLRLGPQHRNERLGVTIGTALGGVAGAERQHEVYLKQGLRAVDTSLALTVFGGSGSSNIAIRYGCTGPTNANSNSCSSGTMAIGEAFRNISYGQADIMIAAGAEAPLYELTFSAFAIIKTMSTNPDPASACRPFDKLRDGFVMGEAAAVLILEELGHALTRNARIYAELLGYSSNNDAHHMVIPRPDGESAVRVMRDVLEEAGVSPREISAINAHASATQLNDRTETAAIKQVFGEDASRIPISATKSMHGHALGASGSVEAAICALMFEKNFVPPTMNLFNPDPDCDLDYVPNVGRPQPIEYVLSNSFGFGGINASLLLGRYQG